MDPQPSHRACLFPPFVDPFSFFWYFLIEVTNLRRFSTFMEDLGFGDLLDYSQDTMERIFATMGELAPVGSPFLGMDLEQHLDSMVPPPADKRFFSMTNGSALVLPITDHLHSSTVGEQIPVGFELESSSARENRLGVQGLISSSFSGRLDSNLLTWIF